MWVFVSTLLVWDPSLRSVSCLRDVEEDSDDVPSDDTGISWCFVIVVVGVVFPWVGEGESLFVCLVDWVVCEGLEEETTSSSFCSKETKIYFGPNTTYSARVVASSNK